MFIEFNYTDAHLESLLYQRSAAFGGTRSSMKKKKHKRPIYLGALLTLHVLLLLDDTRTGQKLDFDQNCLQIWWF